MKADVAEHRQRQLLQVAIVRLRSRIMAVTFGMAYVMSIACPEDHGAAWLIGFDS